MIVNNVITIIFFVITGTAFVRCAVAPAKHRLKFKKEGIGHKTNNDDVLLRALSDFGVIRRSLNPMMFEQYSNIQYTKDDRNFSNVENSKNIIIEKLKSSVTFRDNILYIFSYLLHGHENELTEEQYTSLQTLYEFLRKKMVYMYNLLPVLSKLDTTDKNQQTSMILSSLIKNLPSYLQCTAKYLINEIELKRIDLNTLLKSTEFETFDYRADINLNTISKNKMKNEEMIGYDNSSNITQKALGPVFVKLLYNLHANKQSLSQELFGLILINLPNPSNDPVLEENIRYLYDVTKNNVIDQKNWDSIGKNPVDKDVYTLVFSVLTKILNSNVQVGVKDATVYVYHHLKVVMLPTYDDSNFKYMHRLVEKDIDIGMLLSAIISQEFGPDVVRIKDRLLTYFMRNYRNKDMNKILKGFNKFAYSDPLDLLMALLTRLANRIPNTNQNLLQQLITALLPSVIMKKYSRIFTPFVSPEIDVLILLDSLKTPDADQMLQSTVDSIKLELIAQPQISVLLSTLIPTEKEKCLMPKQCLMNTFQQVQKLQNDIPLTLTTKIQNVAYILKTTSPVQHQSQSNIIPKQYSIKPVDVNLYLDRETPVAVAIETDSTYKNSVPSSGVNGVPYVWNIDKYVSGIGPVQIETQDGTSGWETGIALSIDSAETKMISPTIDQTQVTEAQVTKTQVTEQAKITEAKVTEPEVIEPEVTEPEVTEPEVIEPEVTEPEVTEPEVIEPEVTEPEVTEPEVTEEQITEVRVTDYVPTRKDTSDRPLTLRPSFTTSVSSAPSQITYKPTQTTQKPLREPHHVTSQSTVKEYRSEVEYPHTPDIIFHEKEVLNQPSTSEEMEDQTFPPEEVIKDVSMKKSAEMTTHTKPKLLQRIKEKTSHENVSSAMVLPPTIETDQPLKVQLSNSGIPVVTTGDDYNATESEIILPEIKELLKPPEVDDLLRDIDSPIVTQVLQPLSTIFGKNYIKKILKDVNMKLYPTTIALLSAILKKARTYPEVKKNLHLITLIHKYIASIEYVSPTILLPIVVSSKKLMSDVVYSTFNPNDITHSKISENPPDDTTSDSVTLPLVNPKLLLQSINPSDPYADLLPTLEQGNILAITIQPLKMIFRKIVEILGPDFQPFVYPNKGALLITLLHKLLKSKTVQLDAKLKSLIDIYIQALEVPSMNIHVSEDSLVKMMSETTGQWQPELTSLISALPESKNNAEDTMLEELEQFLADPTLLNKLQIAKPPLTITRGDFLHKIILSALSGKIRLEKRILKVLKYYKNKVEFTDMGALPIMWMWVETYIVKAEVQLGNMIQQTVNFNELTRKEKLAYNDLITHLAQNSNLLQDNDDFDFEKYKIQGQFVKGLFKHLLKKPQLNSKVKKEIQMILPRVTLTGAGAIPMPSLSGS